MVADRRLGHVAARGEVACTNATSGRELAENGEAAEIGDALEKEHVGISLAFHTRNVLTDLDIVKYQYAEPRETPTTPERLLRNRRPR